MDARTCRTASVTGRTVPHPGWAKASDAKTFTTVAAATKWMKAGVDAAAATETGRERA
ncbi:hypothetical protein [Streptomyces sp. NPDC058371]|uniref:hypothetical protein n=1 Tax=Streptomyces sp. NPDC058371 TaxID=3346463 RepID=UPI00366A250E